MNGKNLEFVILLDIYGDILTQKQKDVMELYYCEDLSLSEIAEDEGVTRQAVRDSIKRGEQMLTELEGKLGLAEKILKCKDIFDKIENLAGNVSDKKEAGEIFKLAEAGKELL